MGVAGEGSIEYNHEYSHRLLQDEDKESSTTITVEFGDCEFLSILLCRLLFGAQY